MVRKSLTLFDSALMGPAIADSFRKLSPAVQVRNPVMFVVYIGSILTSILFVQALRGAGPWGQGFPEPVFDGQFRIRETRIVGGKHLKLQLRAAHAQDGASLDAIAFGHVGGATDDVRLRSGAAVRLAFRLEVNEYRGNERLQLNCQHLEIDERAGGT